MSSVKYQRLRITYHVSRFTFHVLAAILFSIITFSNGSDSVALAQASPITAEVDRTILSTKEQLTLTVTVTGPGKQRLHYILVDPASSQAVVSGVSESESDDLAVSLAGDVTSTLFPGFYQLYLAAESDSLARITERRVDLEVLP